MVDPTSSISRQHIFPGERLAAFSDAVFSIVATFSVIPLKLSRQTVQQLQEGGYADFNLEDYLYNQWPRYLIYLYSFALVADVWFVHCGVFSIVENVDDPIIWFNLLLLFFVSLVPYATGLISSYSSQEVEQIAIAFCAVVILLFSVILIIILGYAFRCQSLLHPHLVNNSNIRKVKIAIYVALLVEPVLSLLAFGFSFLTDHAPWFPLTLFYLILPISLLVKLGLYMAFNWKNFVERIPPVFTIGRMASKSRAEAFSDGVFAIVATLLVLDLTTENIPEKIGAEPVILDEEFYHQRFVFLSYITTFLVTGMLWIVQYSMFHYTESFTPALSITNTCVLFMIGGIPFVSEILSAFSDERYAKRHILTPNKVVCVRVFSVVVMLAGLLQLFFWCVAHYQKKLSSEVNRRSAETFMFLKIMIIPITGLTVYWGTFSETFMDNQLYTALAWFTPVMFLLLRISMKLWTKYCNKRKKPRRKSSPIATSPTIQGKASPPLTLDDRGDSSPKSPLLDNKSPTVETSSKDVFV